MDINKGDIYIIRNIINNKSYIGQAKHFARHGTNKDGNIKYEKRGWIKRIKEHFTRYTEENLSCPKLYRAINKYGPNVFIYKRLEVCDIDQLDYRETWWIRIFDSFNNGYNASPGGGTNVLDWDRISHTKSMNWFNKEYREKKLDSRFIHKTKDLPSNITEIHKNNELVGYRVKVIRKKAEFSKVYASGYNLTLDNKLELCINWRDSVIELCDNNKDLSIDKIREIINQWNNNYRYINGKPINHIPANNISLNTGLPQYIYILRKKGIEVGYKVLIKQKGIEKQFASSKLTMEQKLLNAVTFRDENLKE